MRSDVNAEAGQALRGTRDAVTQQRGTRVASPLPLTWYLDFLCKSTFSTSIEKRWPAVRPETREHGNARSGSAPQEGACYRMSS